MCSPLTRGEVDAMHLDGAVQPDGVIRSVQDGLQLIQGSSSWEVELNRNQVFVENRRSCKERTQETTHNRWRQLLKGASTASTRVLHGFTCWRRTCRKIFGIKKQNKLFVGDVFRVQEIIAKREQSISNMEWNSLWRCIDWQSCPSVGKALMHPHMSVPSSHLSFATHLSHGHEWPSSHRHWTAPSPSDLQT